MLISTKEYFIRFTQLTAQMTQVKAWETVEEEWKVIHGTYKYVAFETCKTSFYRWIEKVRNK